MSSKLDPVEETQILVKPASKKLTGCARVRGSAVIVLLVATIALFTDSFIYGCLVPYTPLYSADFHLTDEQLGLVLAAYALTLVIFTPIAGVVCDKYGSSIPFTLGIIAEAAITVLFALVPSLPLIITARLLQGMCLLWLLFVCFLLYSLFDFASSAFAVICYVCAAMRGALRARSCPILSHIACISLSVSVCLLVCHAGLAAAFTWAALALGTRCFRRTANPTMSPPAAGQWD